MAKAYILMILFCGFSLESTEITQIVRLAAIMYLAIKYNYMLTKSSDMPSKNIWGVKKVRGQEEPATKSSDIK